MRAVANHELVSDERVQAMRDDLARGFITINDTSARILLEQGLVKLVGDLWKLTPRGVEISIALAKFYPSDRL